jgi:chemosensory pili system protein ChpA (sensor histidine kinase/response regulator)
LQRTVDATEDDLVAQARQTRELQRDLLRTRMVEFEGISDRSTAWSTGFEDTGKQVKLDLLGGTIEMDRGMLDRMTPALSICCATACPRHRKSGRARCGWKDPAG